jgi:glycosyltransferase involved in cell wall biosynthesis
MRLLIVTQYFWPENFRINDLANELAHRGHEVTVLTGLPNYPRGKIFKEFLDNFEAFSSFEKVKIVRVPLIPRGSGAVQLLMNYISFAISASLLGPWKLRGQKFDVVLICQLSPVFVGLPGAFLAWIKRVKVAMWVLDLWPDTLKALGIVKSPLIMAILGNFVSFIYRRCDLILSQSQSFIPKIKKSLGNNTRVIYFPSWAEDIFKSYKASSAPEVPDKDGSFNVMFAGNVGEAQDFECILSAATLLKKYSHIRWLIVGDGRMYAWVASQIELRNLRGHVLLLGRHPVERMPDFYAKADAMLVTLSDQEIFSMTIPGKLQSYMAAGMPIIAALNGEGANIIRCAKAGFTCSAGNADELASLVYKMAELPKDERQAMGNNGLVFSQVVFDRRLIVDMAEKYLLELCR